jgi:hypothetical protein
MDAINAAYGALSDLSLWTKVQSGDSLKLSDVPAIANLRFQYILDNWSSIRDTVVSNASDYYDLKKFTHELDEFDKFVSIMQTQTTTVKQAANNKSMVASYYSVFDNMYVNDLNASNAEEDLVQAEIDRVNSFKKNTFLNLRKLIIAGRDAIADSIGASDATYNDIYNRSSLPKLLNKSIPEISTSYLFHQSLYLIESILANETILNSSAYVDPFAFARANANNPAIDIKTYSSGSLVKLNYNESLQTLALRTMGDEQRWVEIAIANGLKPPYIDEVGIKIPLASSARSDTVNIAATDSSSMPNKDKIYINQIVILQSDVEVMPDQRTIIAIKEIPVSGELIIQLSGSKDLDKYKSTDNAYIRVFAPNTINSNFYVLIPSDNPAPAELNKPTPWFLSNKGEDEKSAGVDFLLSNDGDIAISEAGDFRLSYGADNAMQALKILMSTSTGSLIRHFEYGIPDFAGIRNVDPDGLRATIAENISRQITSDPRFSRLEFLTVEYLSQGSVGPSGYMIKLGVVLAGGAGNVIPISFSVNVPQ